MSAPRSRKNRRLIVTGHRAGIAARARGAGVVARSVRRSMRMDRMRRRLVGVHGVYSDEPVEGAMQINDRWYLGTTEPKSVRGPRPARKPKEKK